MAEHTEQDRSEPATPFRLEEARRKGTVAHSREVGVAVAIGGALLCLAMFSSWMGQGLLRLERRTLLQAGDRHFDVSHATHWLSAIAERAFYLLSPLLAIVILAGLLANFLQTGPVFSAEALKPDFQRLNPVAGLKRLFTPRTLFEALKVMVKLLLVGAVSYVVLRGIFTELPQLYRMPPEAFPTALRRDATRLLEALGLVLLAIATIDLTYSRWDFARRMRMSRRELREEAKRREGDPQIRSRRRAALREMRKRSAALGKVRSADVVIVNPTRYAVAVQYRRGKAAAPEVIAKASGVMARAIRELAFRYQVPVVSSPELARALFREIALGSMIAPRHYEAVAAILRKIYEKDGKGRKR